ncbi:MAG: helix-turn-helix domain-containing protein, partial [Candidatus Liptonbacteria bacterium]|nr:helix-turn-helix domain-containing protein [Candidatus Liptonbacteria bacterium]
MTAAERGALAILRGKGYSLRAIAHALGRAIATLSEELRRNAVRGKYDPRKAHHKAYVRRKYAKYQGMRIVHHVSLRDFVERMLMDDLSPEAVAGRLRHLPHLPRVSARTIRRFLASVSGRRIETHRWLKRRRRHRRRLRTSLTSRTFIDKRPLY